MPVDSNRNSNKQIRASDQTSGKGSQPLARGLTSAELSFINKVAIPSMDGVKENSPLEHLADSFWALCTWENDRAKALDQKASSLMGLSSIAAAILAMAGNYSGELSSALLLARGISLVLFAFTIGTCLYALLIKQYGSFNDEDVFEALNAHKGPVGDTVPLTVPFTDMNVYRCYLRETILQRWLIYRVHCDTNDNRAKRVLLAQKLALVAVLSLLAQILIVVLS